MFVQNNGYVETLYGRRRYLPNIKSSIQYERESVLRRAVNTPVQGTASDITAFGLMAVTENIKRYDGEVKIVGTIHDSILLECAENLVDEVGPLVIKCMTQNIPRITIPLVADLDILDMWVK
jgi:DNA polymerase-1